MMVSCAQQLLLTLLAGANSALKDEAKEFKFSTFIEAQRRSLTAKVAQATAFVSTTSNVRAT
jgi:hypothetical protein